MTQEKFTEHLKSRLEEITGCEVLIHPTPKNNGVVLTSVTIKREGRNISPTVYVEQFYDSFNKGETIEEILDKIIDIDGKYQLECDFDVSSFTDFEKVKDKLRFKLVNTHKNSKRLMNMPHKKFLDLAKIYFAEVDSIDNCPGTITITSDHMKYWGISDDELDKIATVNTFKNNKIVLMNLKDFIEKEIVGSELNFEGMEISEIPMYAFTFKNRMFGAAAMICEDIIEKFAIYLDDDLYIIPSSIHELLIIPCNSEHQGPDYLKVMINEVNSTQVNNEEVLSNNLYYYSREKDEIVIV